MAAALPSTSTQTHRQQRQILMAAWLLVAVLAAVINVVSPIFEPPDELQHYQFVRYLVDHRKLPIQAPDGPISQSHQPPLYYLGGAVLTAGIHDPQTVPERNPFWDYNGGVSNDNKLQFIASEQYTFPYHGSALVVHIMRLWSTLLTMVTVWAVWQLGRTLWPNQPGKTALLLAFSVLNPMFLYMTGAANNDSMVIMWGALLLWLVVRGLQDGFTWRTTILIGLVWSGALLSKLTGLMLAAPWGMALLCTAWQKRDGRLFFSRLGAVLAIAAALTGWWYVRNWLVYRDPLALQVVLDVWGERTAERTTLAYLWPDLKYSWANFWGRFGYGQVPLPNVVYLFFLLISLLAGAGGIRRLVKRPFPFTTRPAIWSVLLLAVLTYVGALFYYIFRNPTGANGRYIFPALPAIAAILTASLAVWLDQWKRPGLVYTAVIVPIIGIATFTSAIFLPWTYARPQLLSESAALAQVERPANVIWGEQIRLLGTAVTPRTATSGQTVNVTACWQAQTNITTNYTLFVRLLDADFNSLGQRDTYPGLGTFPTKLWQAGDTFCDTYPIPVMAQLTWPVAAAIDLGFYEKSPANQLPITTLQGEPIDHVIIDNIKIQPATAAAPPPLQFTQTAQFAQGVQLIGYNLSDMEAQSEQPITLELAWQAAGPLDQSYTVFVHLLDADGNMITQSDSLPRNGRYPTNFWGSSETILDFHQLTLPSAAPPGPTTFRVGFYRLEDFSRLPRTDSTEQPDFVELTGPSLTGQPQ